MGNNVPSFTHADRRDERFIIVSTFLYVTFTQPSKYLCMNENIELEEKEK